MEADENGEGEIQIEEKLCVPQCENPLLSLVNFVYPNLLE